MAAKARILTISYHAIRNTRYASRFTNNAPSTSVERPLQIQPFYAKQSQTAECPNERNLCCNNGLCQFTPSQPLQKRTQNEPKRTQTQKVQNELNLIYNKGL